VPSRGARTSPAGRTSHEAAGSALYDMLLTPSARFFVDSGHVCRRPAGTDESVDPVLSTLIQHLRHNYGPIASCTRR